MNRLISAFALLGLLVERAWAAGGGRFACHDNSPWCSLPALNAFSMLVMAFLVFMTFKMMTGVTYRAIYTALIAIACIAGTLLVSAFVTVVAYLAVFIGALYWRQRTPAGGGPG